MKLAPKGSKPLSLISADFKPIIVGWLKGVGKYAVTTALVVLASPELRTAVEQNFGTFASTVLGAILVGVGSQRFLSDNRKG